MRNVWCPIAALAVGAMLFVVRGSNLVDLNAQGESSGDTTTDCYLNTYTCQAGCHMTALNASTNVATCAKCPTGKFGKETTTSVGECMTCYKDTYAENEGQTVCYACNADANDDLIKDCRGWTNLDNPVPASLMAPTGTTATQDTCRYQPTVGSSSCLACPSLTDAKYSATSTSTLKDSRNLTTAAPCRAACDECSATEDNVEKCVVRHRRNKNSKDSLGAICTPGSTDCLNLGDSSLLQDSMTCADLLAKYTASQVTVSATELEAAVQAQASDP